MKAGEPSAWEIAAMIFSLISAGYGLLSLTPATSGIGFIGLAVLLAVFLRAAQASRFHDELKRKPE